MIRLAKRTKVLLTVAVPAGAGIADAVEPAPTPGLAVHGTTLVKAGTYVRFHDDAVHWMHERDERPDPDYAFEAGWSPDGAVCAARVRWPEFGSLETIRKTSPRLEAAGPATCTEARARELGALIFDESRIEPRLGR